MSEGGDDKIIRPAQFKGDRQKRPSYADSVPLLEAFGISNKESDVWFVLLSTSVNISTKLGKKDSNSIWFLDGTTPKNEFHLEPHSLRLRGVVSGKTPMDEKLRRDCLWALRHTDITEEALVTYLYETTGFFLDMRSSFTESHENILLFRKELSGSSFEELCTIIRSGNEEKWEDSPDYYIAAIIEIVSLAKKMADALGLESIHKTSLRLFEVE